MKERGKDRQYDGKLGMGDEDFDDALDDGDADRYGGFDEHLSLAALEDEDSDAPADTRIFNGECHYVLIDASPALRSALDELVHKCWYTDELIVVNLAVQENLPLFDDWLRDNLGEDFDVVSVSADMLMTAEDLLEQVLAAMPDTGQQPSGSTDSLLRALNQEDPDSGDGNAPREFLLQIENAHELGEGVFESLMTLLDRHEEMLTPHIVLWGDMTQTRRLQALFQGNKAGVSFFDIEPFGDGAIRTYLRHCWKRRAGNEPLPFDEAQLQHIVDQSGGAADEIDHLAETLLSGKRAGPVWTSLIPFRHAVAAGILLLFLLGMFFLRDGDEPGEEGTVIRLEREPPLAVEPVESDPAEAGTDPVAESAEAEEAMTQSGTSTAAGEAAPQQQGTPAQDGAEEAGPVQDEVAAASAPDEAPRSGELLSYPDSHFFIQLLGSFSEESATQFVRDNRELNGSSGQFYTVESLYQDRPWHIVLYGPYPSRAVAEEARSDLPDRLQQGSPWIRSMADIRQSAAAGQ